MRHVLSLLLLLILFIFVFIFKTKESFYIQYKGVELSPKLNKQDVEDLKKGQLILTNMLKTVDKICRKHNIKYWCGAGTLLGVVRHNGWIPFDGDIDIGMTIDEYDKFKKVINKELPKEYVFEDKPKNKPCSKIRHLFSHYKYTSGTPNYDEDNGLQIDIFLYKEDLENNNILKRTAGIPWKWDKKDIFPLKEDYFEDIKVYIPNNSDLYLKTQYKNYTKMPEIKKRYPHEGKINPMNGSSKMKKMFKQNYEEYERS